MLRRPTSDVGPDGACRRFHDQRSDGVGLVRDGHMTATRQCFELGSGRELIEVPGLAPEQDESREPKATVTGASIGAVAKKRRGAVAFKIGSKPGLGTAGSPKRRAAYWRARASPSRPGSSDQMRIPHAKIIEQFGQSSWRRFDFCGQEL